MNQQIILTNWNLQEAEEIIIKHCLENNKGKTLKECSELLKIAERTLYRKCKEFNIENKETLAIGRAINKLEKSGYKVIKND